ncbi:solute-binding protein [Actinoplanes sp. NBRC 14428]|uniref:D-xylose transport system substrate-binding protein n=1 Tax=Pseudosporangium ferrugineum TaxID=439699 RepID=A0A2T0SAM7_9ACTN|nr:sugar ABC transporter substrate-binding protein [Pseudosporangium ferrugineum]PRY30462.1 D-xylose transport system substrate-binding protein [Pseudosporangium ferrugineum]BCJ49991.1 solute-binding protein [Actinoplanes sp. NBRC 14428]
MRASRFAAVAATVVVLVSACGTSDDSDTSSSGGKEAPTIALFLPESKTTRYEAFDRPLFEAKVKALCPDCKVLYSNADQDAAKQQQQVEAALTQGADALVLDAVDAGAVAPLVNQAKRAKVPVIAYDRLISGIAYEYYVSFNNVRVGEMQGQALLDALAKGGNAGKGQIVMINGSPTDPSSADYKKGAHNVLDGKVKIGREFDTPDWSPDKAQQEMEQAITALGRDSVVGVLSANDGMAGGAIAAMKRAGYAKLPPITGQDAELAAVQRILTGEQYMTIYLDIRSEAEKAAELAVAVVRGEKPAAPTQADNGTAQIPAFLLDPIAVTADKIKDTIVKDKFYPAADICTGAVKAACTREGIQ